MRRLTILVLILAAIYSGYWFVGARAIDEGYSGALTELSSQGWQVDVGEYKNRGYPSRFDVTLSNVTLAPPNRAWRYAAPFVQALALSYAPNEVIAVLPQTQTLALPGETLTITAERLRASTGVAASTDLAYKGFTAEGDKITIASTNNYSVQTNRLLAAMRPSAMGEASYDLYAEVLDNVLIDAFGPDTTETFESLTFDAILTLDKPLNRHSFQGAQQEPVLPKALNLKKFALTWGAAKVIGSGDLDIPTGTPEGLLDLAITNWEDVVAKLVKLGMVEAEIAETYRNMGRMMSDSTGTLNVTITFKDGLMSIGPFPIGPAPRFY